MSSTKIRLTPTETKELHRRLRSRSIAVAEARGAQIILLLAQGHSFASIRRQVSCTDRSINTWKQRFLGQRLPGLASRYRGRAPHPKSAQTQARILAACAIRPATAPPTGAPAGSLATSAPATRPLHAPGARPACSPMRCAATWPAMIPVSRPRQPISSGFISNLPPTRRSFVWMKRAPSRPSTGSIPCCRFRRDEPSATALNTGRYSRCWTYKNPRRRIPSTIHSIDTGN